MPNHTFCNVNIVVCHAFIVRLIDIVHVNKSIAHFVLAAVDKSINNTINAFVTHNVNVHCDSVCISLARDFGQFLFRPVGNALVSVIVERLNKTCTAFNRSVHEKFYPVRQNVL